MNEYDTWFRLLIADDTFEWVTIGDYDTRDEAERAFTASQYADTGVQYRIKKMRGQGNGS